MIPFAALVVTLLVLFTLPVVGDPDPEPLRRDGRVLHVSAESWGEGVRSGLAALALAVFGFVLSLVVDAMAGGVVAGGAIGLAIVGGASARLRYRTTTMTLDDDSLEVRWPRAVSTHTERLALRDIRSVEVVYCRAGAEINSRDYVKRVVRVVLADGTARGVPLPMDHYAGDALVSELSARIAPEPPAPTEGEVAIVGLEEADDGALEALVKELAMPGASSLYRGENHRAAIDPDRRGVVREEHVLRIGIRVERDTAAIVVSIRVSPAKGARVREITAALERIAERVELNRRGDDLVVTLRCAEVPAVRDVECWIAIITQPTMCR